MARVSKKLGSHSIRIEIITAIVLGVLAIACFILQGINLNASTTKMETALFNVLQFLLTVGFSWFSSRAISRADFESSLKRFAISAYRRVMDIEQIIMRLQRESRKMPILNASSDSAHMPAIEAMVLDCTQIVRSSISDWSDVIGEELLALERIQRLQREKDSLASENEYGGEDSKIESIKKELQVQIEKLKGSLPTQLRLQASDDEAVQRENIFAATWCLLQDDSDVTREKWKTLLNGLGYAGNAEKL
jgi:hypothetical protein